MNDGNLKLVKNIQKDDFIKTANGEAAKVLAIVKTICEDNKCFLVKLAGGLIITPWHPIRINNKWT